MKRIIKNYFIPLFTVVGILWVSSCSKLDPTLSGPIEEAPNQVGGAPKAPSLSTIYEQLNQLTGGQGNWIAMEEHSTDVIMGPTRGTDWDDFGEWRRLHLHTWAGDHAQIVNTWNGLNGALFQTTLVAETSTVPAEKAQAQFLRGYFRYLTADLYGQVQTRPATAAANEIPTVLTRAEAIDAIIAEVEAAVPNLPAYNKANRRQATKEAAWTLLAKAYLNKAVYKSDPKSPQGPFTFAAADMNKVIEYCDKVAANPALSIANNYWDNFTWENGTKSTENIFVRHNGGDPVAGNGTGLRWQTSMSFHYNMAPSSWNGFVILSEFYNKFEAADTRRSANLPNYTNLTGNPAGFVVGQAFGPVKPSNPKEPGNIGDPIGPLFDRSGNPLVFTPKASMFFNGEASGIRVNKFPLRPSNFDGSENEFPFYRLSDVLLMKAEAILRGGTPTGGQTTLSIVNSIRAKRGAENLASVNEAALLAERGRELYLEGHRRTDMVRFGVFRLPVEERSVASEGYKAVYPIPTISLATNPNLKQNFGY